MFIPMYKKGRALNFGKKYPGKRIEEVIAKDPEYVVWCLEHVEHFDLDNELYGLLEDAIKANNIKRNNEYWTSLRERTQRRESTPEPASLRITWPNELGQDIVIDASALVHEFRFQEYLGTWTGSEE